MGPYEIPVWYTIIHGCPQLLLDDSEKIILSILGTGDAKKPSGYADKTNVFAYTGDGGIMNAGYLMQF